MRNNFFSPGQQIKAEHLNALAQDIRSAQLKSGVGYRVNVIPGGGTTLELDNTSSGGAGIQSQPLQIVTQVNPDNPETYQFAVIGAKVWSFKKWQPSNTPDEIEQTLANYTGSPWTEWSGGTCRIWVEYDVTTSAPPVIKSEDNGDTWTGNSLFTSGVSPTQQKANMMIGLVVAGDEGAPVIIQHYMGDLELTRGICEVEKGSDPDFYLEKHTGYMLTPCGTPDSVGRWISWFGDAVNGHILAAGDSLQVDESATLFPNNSVGDAGDYILQTLRAFACKVFDSVNNPSGSSFELKVGDADGDTNDRLKFVVGDEGDPSAFNVIDIRWRPYPSISISNKQNHAFRLTLSSSGPEFSFFDNIDDEANSNKIKGWLTNGLPAAELQLGANTSQLIRLEFGDASAIVSTYFGAGLSTSPIATLKSSEIESLVLTVTDNGPTAQSSDSTGNLMALQAGEVKRLDFNGNYGQAVFAVPLTSSEIAALTTAPVMRLNTSTMLGFWEEPVQCL